MALFKIHKGEQFPDSGQITKATEGFAYFTTKDGKFYIDIAGDGTTQAIIRDTDHPDGNRVPLNAAKADYVGHDFTIRIQDGTTENSDQYAFNGAADKELNFVAGTGISLNATANTVAIINSAQDTLTGTPAASKTLTSFDQVNGRVIATFSNIAIDSSQLTSGVLTTAQGGTGHNSYTANRVIYSESDTKLSSNNNLITSTAVTYGNRTTTPTLRVNSILYVDSSVESGHQFVVNQDTAGASYYLFSNNQSYGRFYVNKIGQAPEAIDDNGEIVYSGSVTGETYLSLGNNKIAGNNASGQSDNARGSIFIYGIDDTYTRLRDGEWYGSNLTVLSGTDSTAGNTVDSIVILGNSNKKSAAKASSTGVLRIYGDEANYTDIKAQGNGNRIFFLPNYAGNMYALHAGDNSAIGSTSQPVYVAANGRVTAITGSIANDITGNAATATEFKDSTTISLSGDVSGSASSKRGWSITTTIGAGKVTNSMLAGSITNNKLVNSTIGIAGTTVALGSSIDKTTLLSNLGLTNAAHYIGKATANITDGGTENPSISGYNFTSDRKSGDIVLGKDGDKEYIWGLNGWELLGPVDTISASLASGTANRMAYYSAQNMVSATSSHYVSDTKVGINTTTVTTDYNFEVTGKSKFNLGTSDQVSNNKFVINGNNRYLSIGGAGIQAYNSSNEASLLYLNSNGGTVQLGTSNTTPTLMCLYGGLGFHGYIAHPHGGALSALNLSDTTGAIQITLPQVKSKTMVSFKVHIYTYRSDVSSVVYTIGGYLYDNDNIWYGDAKRVYSEGYGPYRDLSVRFCVDAEDKACVTIGEIDTVWSYPKVVITDVIVGNGNYGIEKWVEGWKIEFVTSLPTTVKATIESPSSINYGTTKYIAYYKNANQLAQTKNAHFNWSDLSGTTKGYEELVLGDASNRFGRLALYGHESAAGGAYIVAKNPTSWLNHVLPDTAGWIVTAGNGSSTGAGSSVRPVYVGNDGVAVAGEYVLPCYHSNIDFTDTNPNPGVYRMQTTHPVTGVAEYGGVISMTKTSATGKGYDAQLIISSASGSNEHHVYVRRLTSTPAWLSWTKVLTEHDVAAKTTLLSFGSTSTVATINGNDIQVTLPSNPNTHYTSKNIVGASATATANAAVTASTNSIFLNHLEESTVKSSNNIVGTGLTTVASDANGKITINSSYTPPTATSSDNGIGRVVAGTGIGVSYSSGAATVTNSGVRSIATGTTNGTISVNTNGTSANVSVYGLGSAAYTASTDYAKPYLAYYANQVVSTVYYITTSITASDTGTVWVHGEIIGTKGTSNVSFVRFTARCYKISADSGEEYSLKYWDPLGVINTFTLNFDSDRKVYFSFTVTERYSRMKIFIDKDASNGNTNYATEVSTTAPAAFTKSVDGIKQYSVLANSGATAGSYGPSANATPGYGDTFNVPYISVDAKGRITEISTKTVKIPASDNTDTTYSAGTGLSLSGTTFNHSNSVTANTTGIGPSADASPAHGGTFSVPFFKYDAQGHITAASSKTITLPVNRSLTIKLNNNDIVFDGSADTSISFYAPTAGGTANTQALVGNGATAAPKWVNIAPSITIGAGTGSAAPTVNVTVLGQSGTAKSITTASTSVYGVTKLTDTYTSSDSTLAATGASILKAIQTLDIAAVGGGTGEYISKISETDGKISATKTTTSVSNAWEAGTTAGPKIKTTVNGITGTAEAIPSASTSASGIVTTGAQQFKGRKKFGYMELYGEDGGTAKQYLDIVGRNNAGTAVAEIFYNFGNATNITTGQWSFRSHSPNSTANTSTSGGYETFSLPAVTAGLSSGNHPYSILTTKNTITVGQGGTNNTSFTKDTLIYAEAATKLSSNTNLITNTEVTYAGRTLTPTLRVNSILYADSRIECGSYFLVNKNSKDASYYLYTNNVQYGRLFTTTVGTVGDGTNNGAIGCASLYLGNSTPVSTSADAGANNAYGRILLYGTGAHYSIIRASDSVRHSSYYLPLTYSGTSSGSQVYYGRLVAIYSGDAGGAGTTIGEDQFINNVGSGTNPVYVNKNGLVKPSTSTVGTDEKPVYLSSGTITQGLPMWSLQGGTVAASNDDLNASKYKAIGNYYSDGDAKSKTILHNPYADDASTSCLSFTLKTQASLGTGTQYLRQTWISYNSGVEAERTSTNSGSSWSGWRTKVFKNSNASTKAGDSNLPVYIAANGEAKAVTAKDTANNLINALTTGSSTPVDADYYVSQYVGGGTTTTTYHRRPMSALWDYIKGHITNDLYWANIKVQDTSKTDTTPTFKTIYFGTTDPTASGRGILTFSSTYPNYGLWYFNDSTDIITLDGHGKANSKTEADLAINALGAGVISTRNRYIPHTGNTTGTVGNGTKLIYVNAGTITASTSSVGNSYTPSYLSSGTVTACSPSVIYSTASNTSASGQPARLQEALKSIMPTHNNSRPEAVVLSTSNTSVAFGYTLTGSSYNTVETAYGGYFIAHYNIPRYQGISGGTWSNRTIVTNATNAQIGGSTQPVYVDANGIVQTIGYTIAKSVPSDANFNNTWTALSTSAAGYVAKAPNDTTKFLCGDATWAVVAAAKTTSLSFGTTSTIATVGGHDIKVTMPANPNVDTKVNYKLDTATTKAYVMACTSAPTSTATARESVGNTNIYLNCSTGVLMGAAWNDYAEFRQTKENKMISPGRVVKENGDDSLSMTEERLCRGCSIVSDTYGFGIGESEQAQLPVAVSGRVLAYPYESREEFRQHIGWPVCSGPNGTVSIMTEEEEERYPSRIIGTVSAVPDYEIWHGGTDIRVDGRVWIKVK